MGLVPGAVGGKFHRLCPPIFQVDGNFQAHKHAQSFIFDVIVLTFSSHNVLLPKTIMQAFAVCLSDIPLT
jgi:hypothetical protein